MKDLESKNKIIYKKERSSFMWNKTFFNLDTFHLDDQYFSVCIIQGFKDKSKVKLPDLIKKNSVKTISDDIVDILSEVIARGGN